MDDETKIPSSRDQLSCTIGDDVVLLNQTTGIFYSLSHVGARIWDILQSSTTFRALRDTIVNEYEVDCERASADLLGLLTDLGGHGLIIISTTGPAASPSRALK